MQSFASWRRVSDPTVGAKPVRSHSVDYNKLMKAFSRAGEVDEVLRLFSEMKGSNLMPNVFCYNTVINALVFAERFQEAEAFFAQMISAKVTPNISTYNIIVKLHSCYLFRFDMAYEVVETMVRCGCRPDSITYSTLIAGLCRVGRIEEAWGVLDRMLQEKCSPTVYTYTPIVQGYCLGGKIKEARNLMRTMESVGFPPNVVAYNVLVEALCKIGCFDEVEKILEESSLKGWKPNAVTYNTYMNGLCKWGKAREAFAKLEVMLVKGLYPTVVTLNILLHCLCRDSEVLVARCLLERSTELEWYVGVVSYNTVMSRLCDFGRWWDVLKLLIGMLKKGIDPNTRTFNIAIQCLCKCGNVRLAKCIADSGGFVANVVTYNTLIHWFYLERKINEIQLLLSDMEMKNIYPDTHTYAIMIDGLCREGKFLEGINCCLGAFENKGFLDLVVGLIYSLVKTGKVSELLFLLEGMVNHGFVPDALIFDSVIRAFCSKGFCHSSEMFKVCVILDKILTME